MANKACAVTGAQASCADWCNRDFLQQHCPDCQCAGCDFCTAASSIGSCEPLPNTDDSYVQQCQPFCEEKDKKSHCLRCSCQSCDYCPGKDKLAERDSECKTGHCAGFCDPLYKQQHCDTCDCKACSFCHGAEAPGSCAPFNKQDVNNRQCEWICANIEPVPVLPSSLLTPRLASISSH